jgi:hypothetical protein
MSCQVKIFSQCQLRNRKTPILYVILLHLSIGETCSRQGDLLQTYYKITSFIIHYLGAFAVGEATASVHRTKLAVVRRKCTSSRVTRKRDSDQTRPADT